MFFVSKCSEYEYNTITIEIFILNLTDFANKTNHYV